MFRAIFEFLFEIFEMIIDGTALGFLIKLIKVAIVLFIVFLIWLLLGRPDVFELYKNITGQG